MFSVLDKAVGAYMPPFFCRSKGEGVRQFTDAVNEQNSPFARHLADFELYSIGYFDQGSGLVTTDGCLRVISALEVIVKE